MKIAHSIGEQVPTTLVGEGDESLLCDTETERQNSSRYVLIVETN